MTVLPRIRCGVPGASSTSGASSAPATTAPIAVLTTTWLTVPGASPMLPASGVAAMTNATPAMAAMTQRRRASWCIRPTGMTVSSASSMPAANQENSAGSQFIWLTPNGRCHGSAGQAKLATPSTAMAGTRQSTGSRRASSASTGSTR